MDKYKSYFLMSIAYLEVGEVCSRNINGQTGDYQNAVAYQLFHALELFFKYAILKSNGNVEKIHDLSKLMERYDALYPDEEFRIEHPFDFSSYEPCELNLGEEEMVKNHLMKFKPKFMDQHLRYPPDSNTGGYSYTIDKDCFLGIKRQFIELYQKINLIE